MVQKSIICPNCKNEIELTRTLMDSIEEDVRKDLDQCLAEREAELRKKETELDLSIKELDGKLIERLEEEKKKLKGTIEKEAEEKLGLELKDLQERLKEKEYRVRELEEEDLKLRKKERELQDRERDIERKLEEQIEGERLKIREEVEKKAGEKLSIEMRDLQERLKEKEESIEKMRQEELSLRKKQRELEDREKQLQIEMERRMDTERKKIEEKTMESLQEEYRHKDMEREKTINDLREQIEIMKRRAELGSQQLQGEVLELELEEELARSFPFDDIEEVKKGVRGADILQKVRTNTGFHCGTILWETKRAKDWSAKWISKLKDDMKEAKADIAVLCTTELPKEVDKFSLSGDVVVTSTIYALPVAALIRDQVLRISRERSIMKDYSDKKDLLYTYLTGSEFRQSVEGIVDAFVEMKGDLDSEKRALEKHWAVREKQILRALSNLSSIYGSMQGLAGASLPSIRNLEIERIPGRIRKDGSTLDEF
ncbi:MAG: DUF2130 domain-containing protein [Thermoplasmatota archaeon]